MSYSNYSTYLKYKNCCRPIGDTGPPGPAGPTGPAATIDISGSKGEILYFSETDNLVSTDNVFIQEANVTINNNLVVTGTTYLNNTLEVNGNLSMNDQFINDVSGIYFSDATYISHGSSFDITTSERLDISAAAGVIITGNLIIDSATTLNGNLNFKTAGHISSSASIIAINTVNLIIDADTIIDRTLTVQSDTTINGNLNFSSTERISSSGSTTIINTGGLTIDAATTINGNLSMNDQFINDVSGIYFSDATYISHGSSFDITTSETLDISAAGGVTITGNLTVKDAATFQSDTTINGNLNFSSTERISSSGSTTIINTGGLTIDAATTINGNLSMNDQFINDVSGIYFSDATYISHGSSFDITTSETLDISAAGGVTITGNLTVKDAATFQSDTTINGNLNFSSTERISSSGSTTIINTGGLTIDAATTIRSNLSMDNNFINDVSGIYFSDATYISHGSSFDITTSKTLDISASGGINLNTDVTINSNITINSNLTANTINTQRLLFPSGNYIDDDQGVGKLYVNGNTILAHQVQLLSTLDVSGATTIRSNLSMNDNFINDVSGIIFTQGNLLFSDFSSSTQQVQLPSSQGQPISLERKTLFYDDNFNNNIPGSSPFIIDFTNTNKVFNQLKLNVNGNIISHTPDISGQYVEIYANFDVSSNTSPTKTFSLDISSVSGVDFLETIDVRSINKQGSFYLTFGPHIFIPSQWENTTGFNFIINNSTNNPFFVNKYKLMFKSYFM